MRRCVIILVLILFTTSAGAEITASLEVSSRQDIPGGPYRQAELTLENFATSPVETILLKPAGVGLTVRYKLTVPPGSDGKQLILLPAISPAQEYALTALDASGEVIGRTSASITWPAELVTADAFIDDAFRAWTDDPARWTAKSRWNYLLVLAMFVTVAAAVLFIRQPLLRAGAVVVIAAGAAALLVFVFIPTGPETVQVHLYKLFLHDGVGGLKFDSFEVLAARRTTEWELSGRTSPLPHPVYPDREAAANDDTLVDPVAFSIRLTFRPGQVRVIRPSWCDFPREMLGPRRGSVRREADGFAIETDLIHPRAVLIRNDSLWRLGSDTDARKASIRTDQAESYAAFMSGEGGRKLNVRARRLLNYWRNKHQQAGEFYLMNTYGGEDGASIEVVQLVEVSAW